jgi:hypothetical protein
MEKEKKYFFEDHTQDFYYLPQNMTNMHDKIACHLNKGCTNPGRHVCMATKFCMVACNICGFSVLNLLLVTLLVPTIFNYALDFATMV